MDTKTIPEGFIERPFNRTYIAVLTFFIVAPLVLAPYAVWWRFTWINFFLFLVFYVFSGLGATMGLHRYFTHRSFEVTVWWLDWVIAIQAAFPVEGPILGWVIIHLIHHDTSDTPQDPHTPWIFRLMRTMEIAADEPATGWDIVLGFFYAHTGWLYNGLVADLKKAPKYHLKNPAVVFVQKWYWPIVVVSVLVPAVIDGGLTALFGGSFWRGFVDGIIWCGFLRIGMVHHITWSINSLCHTIGDKPFMTGDHSGNIGWVIMKILSFGECLHNWHHAFQYTARNGLNTKWWEDLTYTVIAWFKKRGWVGRVSVVTEKAAQAKLKPGRTLATA